jgi:hypothetical protein
MTILRGRRFKFRMYGKDYLQGVKKSVAEMTEPFSQSEYVDWLKEKQLTDNQSTRLRWLAHAEVKRRAMADGADVNDS